MNAKKSGGQIFLLGQNQGLSKINYFLRTIKSFMVRLFWAYLGTPGRTNTKKKKKTKILLFFFSIAIHEILLSSWTTTNQRILQLAWSWAFGYDMWTWNLNCNLKISTHELTSDVMKMKLKKVKTTKRLLWYKSELFDLNLTLFTHSYSLSPFVEGKEILNCTLLKYKLIFLVNVIFKDRKI